MEDSSEGHLIDSGSSHHGYALAEGEEHGVDNVGEADVMGGEGPAKVLAGAEVPNVERPWKQKNFSRVYHDI